MKVLAVIRWLIVLALCSMIATIGFQSFRDTTAGWSSLDRPDPDFFINARLDTKERKPIKGIVGCWNPGHAPSTQGSIVRLSLDRPLCVRFRDTDGWVMDLALSDQIPASEFFSAEDIILIKKYLEFREFQRAKKPNPPREITPEEKAGKLLFNRLYKQVWTSLYPVINGVHIPVLKPNANENWKRRTRDEDMVRDIFFPPAPKIAEVINLKDGLACNFGFSRPVSVTLAFDLNDKDKLPPLVAESLVTAAAPAGSPNAQEPLLILASPLTFATVILLLVLLIGIFLRLCFTTNILRDPSLRWRPHGLPQISLTHFQLSLWFFLVFAAFLYIWVLTGRFDGMSQTALFLVGIALVTSLGSATIPISEDQKELTLVYNETIAARADMTYEEVKYHVRSMLNQTKEALANLGAEGHAPDSPKVKEFRRDLAEYLRQDSFLRLPRHQRWVADLLSEDGEITLHRFQMLAWTLGLGVIFTFKVISELRMPDFPAEVLALMGISAGTYLGFRIPESRQIRETLLSQGSLNEDSKRSALRLKMESETPTPAK